MSVSADASPLSVRLREATRAAHERVEHGAEFNRLIVVRLPRDHDLGSPADRLRRDQALVDYRDVHLRFLYASLGFESACLRRVAEAGPLSAALLGAPPAEDPSAPGLIAADIAEVHGIALRLDAVIMPGLRRLQSPGELLGMEYVRLGSRAGTAVIAAAVKHNLGHDAERGSRFLARHGRATRAHLDRLREWLDRQELSPRECARAIASAIHTFDTVGRWHHEVERMDLRPSRLALP
jgi:heme oxygenase